METCGETCGDDLCASQVCFKDLPSGYQSYCQMPFKNGEALVEVRVARPCCVHPFFCIARFCCIFNLLHRPWVVSLQLYLHDYEDWEICTDINCCSQGFYKDDFT